MKSEDVRSIVSYRLPGELPHVGAVGDLPVGQTFGPEDNKGNDGPNDNRVFDDTPNDKNMIYRADAPGFLRLNDPENDALYPIGSFREQRANLLTWVSVNGVWDPKCDPIIDWHSVIQIRKRSGLDVEGNPEVWWERVGINSAGRGHVMLGYGGE